MDYIFLEKFDKANELLERFVSAYEHYVKSAYGYKPVYIYKDEKDENLPN